VIIGSRDINKARAAVSKIGLDGITPSENPAACRAAELVVIAVPWDAAEPLARKCASNLAGKVVVSMANAIAFVDGKPQPIMPQTGSVALAVQVAAPEARVVAALHHVPARELAKGAEADVLVCGDDAEAVKVVCELLDGVDGLDGLEAGPLALASAVEAFTAVLLSLNQIHKGRAHIKFWGLEGRPE
jgi:NADPH-dependent F420 reductase